MKRRRPLDRVRVSTDYPPGWSGSPNRYSFPIVPTYYRVYRSTSTHTCQGSMSVSHSWWCETDSTLTNVTIGPFKTWQEAIASANRSIRNSAQKAVAS